MNSNRVIFRFLNKSTRVYSKHGTLPRVLHQLYARTATSVSVSPPQNEKETFIDMLPSVIDTVVSTHKFSQVPGVGNWVKKVLDYNLRGGKMNRGLSTVFSYKMLEKSENISEDSLHAARVMGWCVEMNVPVLPINIDVVTVIYSVLNRRSKQNVFAALVVCDICKNSFPKKFTVTERLNMFTTLVAEMEENQPKEVKTLLQAYLLVLDDIMDGASTRRGVPCWYRLPDVGLGAINDSILIQSSIFQLLKIYFNDKPFYTDVVDLFNETLMNTSIGQHLDYVMAHRNKNDYSMFTTKQYNAIVKHKTAYYTYKLPVSLGLYLTNNTDRIAHQLTEEICLDIGQIFQIQDDYIDCYSDESVSGKAGTDIQEGKCSWLAVTALQRCNSAQRVVFETCYGSKEPAHVERIKQLYNQLEIPKVYREEERLAYEKIMSKIRALPESLSPPLFTKLIDMIYHRKV